MKKSLSASTAAASFLSAAIFVLWSFGVIIIPALTHSGVLGDVAPDVPTIVAWGYVALQAVVLAYALGLCWQLLPALMRGKRGSYLHAALYVYAVVMLAVSLWFTVQPLG